MPDATIASAASRTTFSFTSQWNLFQLFHPMGGVRASPSDAVAGPAAAPRTMATARAMGLGMGSGLLPPLFSCCRHSNGLKTFWKPRPAKSLTFAVANSVTP